MTDTLMALRQAFAARADPARAAKAQAYMKSAMPFHGVPMPEVRRLARAAFADLELTSLTALERAVRSIWDGARFREERYAALALLRQPRHGALLTNAALDLYEHLIHTGAWWDLVDEVATHQLHPLLVVDHAPVAATLRRWSRSDDLWLRRAAIIAQVQAKAATDVELLFELIEPAVDEREFFLRKAIGWALRALGPWDPGAVVGWLDANAERASGLTRREAEKGLEPRRRRAPGARVPGSRRGQAARSRP
jgi:3-methyladenine DNA glycosylase AlkD